MKKKIIIVVGTRPNFIKITQFDKEFEKYKNAFEFRLVHTGQHYDYNMSDVFFQQLNIRKPDYFLGIPPGSPTFQMGSIIIEMEKVIDDFKPHLVMVVGDVNSTFAAAFATHKKGIKLAHIESGLRSHDRDMPEEINRILTDQITDYFFVTEQSGFDNLLKEGKQREQIYFVGNTMIDTLVAFNKEIDNADILNTLNVKAKEYALVTIHRPSNVDTGENLSLSLEIIEKISASKKVVFPIHPRTVQKIASFGFKESLDKYKNIVFCDPLDYFSFQKLIKESAYVLTDSGGVQEETTFRQVPCLTLRKNTERPSTVDVGSNELLDFEIERVLNKINEIEIGAYKSGTIPPFWDGNATKRIVEILHKMPLN